MVYKKFIVTKRSHEYFLLLLDPNLRKSKCPVIVEHFKHLKNNKLNYSYCAHLSSIVTELGMVAQNLEDRGRTAAILRLAWAT